VSASIRRGTLEFSKAVTIGALAGASPGLLLTVPFGLSLFFDESMGSDAIILIASPFIISFVVVLVSSILIGLPLTFALNRMQAESQPNYVLAGSFAGALIAIAWIAQGGSGAFWVALFTAAVGGITGWHWGSFRERARYRELE
jgi:hypothetical protein